MKVHHEQRGRVQCFCMGGWGNAPHRARDCRVFLELKRRAPEPLGVTATLRAPGIIIPRAVNASRVAIVRIGTTKALAAIVHRVLQSGIVVVLICGAIRRSIQLQRDRVSSLRQLAQAGVTPLRAFNYFVGDHPSGTVFFACGMKQTRALKSLFHLSHRSAVKGLGDHFPPPYPAPVIIL